MQTNDEMLQFEDESENGDACLRDAKMRRYADEMLLAQEPEDKLRSMRQAEPVLDAAKSQPQLQEILTNKTTE